MEHLYRWRTVVVSFVVLVFFSQATHAQDTLQLNEAVVSVTRDRSVGTFRQTLDSSSRAPFMLSSIGQALSFNTPIAIRSYGPGGISSMSFRGGSASQTAVLWNGFNLQNNMLGQTDLSLLPSILFNSVTIEYGGSSGAWGSGAAAGNVRLSDRHAFGAGNRLTALISGGSFGTYNGAAVMSFSRKRFISVSKIYQLQSDNNYTFISPYDQQKHTLTDASYTMRGFMQELKWRCGEHHEISINGWGSMNQRKISPMNDLPSARQFDGDWRLAAHWQYNRTFYSSHTRFGWFNEQINYNDVMRRINSSSTLNTFIGEHESSWHPDNDREYTFAVNGQRATGVTADYNGTRSISRLSAVAGARRNFKNGLSWSGVVRGEVYSSGNKPLTFNTGLSYKWRTWTLGWNIARVYRQPTLNEMYWQPGGNPDLLPEKGMTSEGNICYEQQIGRWKIYVNGAAYTRSIHDWILWLPGQSGNPTPVNVLKVWSRGAETTTRAEYKWQHWKLTAGVITSYVLSTIVDASDNTNGRQLVYTPRYLVNDHASVQYKNTSLYIYHQYVGYRFITSDNTQWLDPYHIFSIRLSQSVDRPRWKANIYVNINNLTGTAYQQIAGRPLPGSAFEVGLIIQSKPKQQS